MPRPHVDLSPPAALAALAEDFRQYPPQGALFARLCLLCLGLYARPVDKGRGRGLLIRLPGPGRDRFVPGQGAARLLTLALRRRPPSPRLLALVCGLTFWRGARVVPGQGGRGRRIRVYTGMEDYRCLRCGRCCLTLCAHDQCRPQDLEAWRRLGRTDILERVYMRLDPRTGRGLGPPRLWRRPGTPLLEEVCPWLTPTKDRAPAVCRIHAVKPAICREYPGSYKHAVMTGCRGFPDLAARS